MYTYTYIHDGATSVHGSFALFLVVGLRAGSRLGMSGSSTHRLYTLTIGGDCQQRDGKLPCLFALTTRIAGTSRSGLDNGTRWLYTRY